MSAVQTAYATRPPVVTTPNTRNDACCGVSGLSAQEITVLMQESKTEQDFCSSINLLAQRDKKCSGECWRIGQILTKND